MRGLARFDGRAALHHLGLPHRHQRLPRRAPPPAAAARARPARRTSAPEPRPTAPGLDAAVADRLDVDAALAALPPDFRAAVVLRDLCGLDYAEIAEVLGIPPGTVRSRIARGRAALARDLARREPADADRPSEPHDMTDARRTP